MVWQLQDAKSKFSRLVNQALADGPQIVTRHGTEVVIVLSIDEYRRLLSPAPTLLSLLQNSPLVGSELVLERDATDHGREIDL